MNDQLDETEDLDQETGFLSIDSTPESGAELSHGD